MSEEQAVQAASPRRRAVRFYLVRHGQTDWNATERYQGQTDVPLDGVGRAQVLALRPRLEGVPFTAVYSSTLSRAYETAALLVPAMADAIVRLDGLNEMSYGAWEGRTRQEIAALFPADWQRYEANPDKERPTGGETRAELHLRAVATLYEIATRHAPGSQILSTAHGGTLRALVAEVLGVTLHTYSRLSFDNASLSIIDVYGSAATATPAQLKGSVLLLNDTAHLEPVKGLAAR